MREFLRGLNLDDEQIDSIMTEVGKGYAKLKDQVSEYKDQVSKYETQIQELNQKAESDSKSLESLQNLTDENKNLKAELIMNGSNVKKEFQKFVRSEVMAGVNDENDFAKVLEGYKESNPQYFGEAKVVKTQTSPVLAGGSQPQTTNDIMNNIIRGNK